jgi:two-component system, OmpR family, phosphate regulon sensor histidine kinase PhoR
MSNLTPSPAEPTEEGSSIDDLFRELRAPITTIKTALSLLDSPNLKPAQRSKYLEMIRGECNRQNALLDGSAKLFEVEKQSLENVQANVADILPAVVGTFQPLAGERGILLSCNLPTDLPLPLVSCSEAWLKQIAMNLVDNSLKFTLRGGAISIYGAVQNNYVQLEFRDNGVGIPSADLPRIFDRFYRGRNLPPENQVSCAGLGLTVVQQILLRCGGSISVVSQVDTGSRFRVMLPIAVLASPAIVDVDSNIAER